MSVFIGTGLVFVGERDCRAEEVVIDEATLQPGQLVIELEVSVVSAGTEVANFTGLDPGTRVPGSWNAYPHRPGYGAVGRVVAIGPPLPGLTECSPSVAMPVTLSPISQRARSLRSRLRTTPT